MKVLNTETTPNPDALKFIVDEKLVAVGAKSYDHPLAAKDDALAQALFAIGPIHSVFYMDRFVTVSKLPNAQWQDLTTKITQVIEANAKPVVEQAPTPNGKSADQVLDEINRVLDENVRPALAGDGGGLEIIDYSDFTLTVHYQGACGSCPSSTSGTLFAIQNLLKSTVDPRIQVVPD